MSRARWIATGFGAVVMMCSAIIPAWADCPLSLIQIGNLNDSQVTGPSATRHADPDFYGWGDAWFLSWGDSLAYSISSPRSGSMEVNGSIEVFGPNPGSSVSFQLETHVSGNMQTSNSVDGCFNTGSQLDELFVAGVQVGSHTWTTQGAGYPLPCTSTFQLVYDVPVSVTAGEVVPIRRHVSVLGSSFLVSGYANFGLSLWFRDLPPGAFVVACDGDTARQVLAVGGRISSGLALEAIWPNPSRGEIHASCALPRGGPVMLRLFDAAGRVTETRVWDSPAATRREVTLGGHLAPGAYFLQISQGAKSTAKAVTIVR